MSRSVRERLAPPAYIVSTRLCDTIRRLEDSLKHCLVDELERPHSAFKALDAEVVQARQVLHAAQLDIELDLIT